MLAVDLSDAVCGLRGWRDAGEQAANRGNPRALLPLDAMVQVALDELEWREMKRRGGFSLYLIKGVDKRPTKKQLKWALEGIAAHDDFSRDDDFGSDLRTVHAALAEKSA